MPDSYETRADVEGDGALSLTGLPFPAGTRVEIVVRAVAGPETDSAFPLRGVALRYDDPFEPVVEEWDALRPSP